MSHRIYNFLCWRILLRQILVGYLLLSYIDNLLRRKRKKNRTWNSKPSFCWVLFIISWNAASGRGWCNFTRELSTSYPGLGLGKLGPTCSHFVFTYIQHSSSLYQKQDGGRWATSGSFKTFTSCCSLKHVLKMKLVAKNFEKDSSG